MKILKIHHIGVAVRSIEEALKFFQEQLGLELEKVVTVKGEDVRTAFLKVGESYIELLEPLGSDTPVGRFIEKRGEGIHHIAFEVDSVSEFGKSLGEAGVRLVNTEPRLGADGLFIFIHPKSAHRVLIELVEPTK